MFFVTESNKDIIKTNVDTMQSMRHAIFDCGVYAFEIKLNELDLV